MMNSISSAPGAKITSALFDILTNLQKCLETEENPKKTI